MTQPIDHDGMSDSDADATSAASSEEELEPLPELGMSSSLHAPLISTAELASDPAFAGLSPVKESKHENAGEDSHHDGEDSHHDGEDGEDDETRVIRDAEYADSFEADDTTTAATGTTSSGSGSDETDPQRRKENAHSPPSDAPTPPPLTRAREDKLSARTNAPAANAATHEHNLMRMS